MRSIRNITVSGRIASGTTTLAQGVANALDWELFEGGALFEKYHADLGVSETQAQLRPDTIDLQFEEMIKSMLKTESHIVVQSHLAGFNAQNIEGVYKILVVCEDEHGNDAADIRIDRLINRKNISVTDAKYEIKQREQKNLEKWRRLYAQNDSAWVYWKKEYYDLVINTYSLNKHQAIEQALDAVKQRLAS